ncbi:hypothetical protein [Saccharibacillus sacchari]|uniref:Uncharacterized protein n=1 Tax=Saccharibacillus sacchari TaxID=456493 RepID=A0ACC6P7J4_9BACL
MVAIKPVKQNSANSILQSKLNPQKEYTFQDIKNILVASFDEINDNQCAGLIHRAHSKVEGVLVKKEKLYRLRATADSTNEEDGLSLAKSILKDALREIEQIPNSHIKNVDQFNELTKLKEDVGKIIES